MKNKQIYWFKRKRYGYGWVPTTWQGVVTIIIFLFVVIFSSTILLKDVEKNTYQPEVGTFILIVSISILILLGISYKMGPPPRWRWGSKPNDDKELDY
ncbi:MAG: hypothetical protein NUV65_05295 [Candidatus Roizmanbacteria bacterium]|nr:hypothetical protein [Candidatus Roizmanbacteria bacterium]